MLASFLENSDYATGNYEKLCKLFTCDQTRDSLTAHHRVILAQVFHGLTQLVRSDLQRYFYAKSLPTIDKVTDSGIYLRSRIEADHHGSVRTRSFATQPQCLNLARASKLNLCMLEFIEIPRSGKEQTEDVEGYSSP